MPCRSIHLALLLACGSSALRAQAAADTTRTQTFGGFVDTYYAWDFDRPRLLDRAYSTQPARHAEANINLAFVEAKWSGPRYRGRLALQWGTSVQANYAAEPKIGNVSGPTVSQYLQEAFVGYRLTPTIWLDAGVFFAHLGYEGWISRDNLTYTRSLVAEYSPYYETGAKVTWSTTSKLTTTIAVLNGWQNISAENSVPAGGVRFDYAATPALTFTYDNFIGNVAADAEPARLRVYHDVIAQAAPGKNWNLAAVYSLGTERDRASNGGTASWWGATSMARYAITPSLAIVGRAERYSDPSRVLVATPTDRPFRTTGASLGLDVKLQPSLLWRSELRGFRSSDDVWPLHSADLGRTDAFLVSSLSMSF